MYPFFSGSATITNLNGHIYIGASGWSYDHWKGPFYPSQLPADQMLEFYAQHFASVEINHSFYRLPEKKTLQRWCECTADNFLFTAKASRYITHMKKLKDPADSLSAFMGRISVLKNKLGPILFQLPPRWRFNATRLEDFLQILSHDYRYVFEFRDHSWLNQQAYDLLARHHAAFCIYQLDGFSTPQIVTTDFIYVRLHGPEGAYQGSYSHGNLSARAETFKDWIQQGKTVYCYFDNDASAYAVKNAKWIQKILSQS